MATKESAREQVRGTDVDEARESKELASQFEDTLNSLSRRLEALSNELDETPLKFRGIESPILKRVRLLEDIRKAAYWVNKLLNDIADAKFNSVRGKFVVQEYSLRERASLLKDQKLLRVNFLNAEIEEERRKGRLQTPAAA